MTGAHRLLAGLLAAGALLTATTGCAQSVDPIERLGRKAAQRVNRQPSAPAAVRPAAVRGDRGAPGAMVVIACGRARHPGNARPVPPPVRHRPDRPGPHSGERADAGCGRP